MEPGPETTFSAQNRKNQKIHDFRPKKEGVTVFDIFDPPSPNPTPPPPSKPQKSGFQVGGVWGVPDQKLIGVKLTIQPLEVGYANRPKKAKMGGYVAFFPIYACLALI